MYRDLNDYEVLYLIKENDEENYDIIYKKYKPLVYKIARKYQKIYKPFGYEIEDIMQIGYMALFKAVDTFKTDESMFYTYLVHVIENAIFEEIRRNNTLKKKVLNESFSYDILIPNTNNTYLDIIPDLDSEIKVLENEENENRFIILKNTLPFDVSCVFELIFNGYRIEEIMILLNITESKIKECFRVIKRQLLYI